MDQLGHVVFEVTLALRREKLNNFLLISAVRCHQAEEALVTLVI